MSRSAAPPCHPSGDPDVIVLGSGPNGLVAHSDLSPDDAGGAAFGLMLSGLVRQVGMPIPRGGAQAIADALARLLAIHGRTILTGQRARKIVVRDGRSVVVRTDTATYDARRAVVATVQPRALFTDLVGERLLPSDFVSYQLDQQLVFRPVPGWFRYRTPIAGLYMAGASTHPGGGVHGASGASVARVLLGDLWLAKVRDGLDTLGRDLRAPRRWLNGIEPLTIRQKVGHAARARW